MDETGETVIMQRQQVKANHERMASWVEAWFWTHDIWILETHFVTHNGGQRANNSAMIHPFKRIDIDWRVSHPPLSQADFELCQVPIL